MDKPMTATQAAKFQRILTQETYAEIDRALHEASKPFVKKMEFLYSLGTVTWQVKADGTIESIDPLYPPGIKEQIHQMLELKKENDAAILRSFGIDPDLINPNSK